MASNAAADQPPALKTQTEARYPAEARSQHLEATVGLEIVVDADGTVRDAKVTAPVGHGFDEAALEAVKRFVFEPARDAEGRPMKAIVDFAYEFHLPSAPVAPAAPPAGPAKEAPTTTQEGQSTLVLAQRPMSAASASSVRDREFRLRPIATVADILRITPGLLVVQHAGGGKANQYFLRGFDADHGTDIALSVDGIPINMVSHAHGQGYADTNFIIPELVERVELTKGPYFAEQGDFATAGAINLVTRQNFEHSSVGFGLGGSPESGGLTYRGLMIASPKLDTEGKVKPLLAAEIGRANGPFQVPNHFDNYKVFGKVTVDNFTVGASSYSGAWTGSGEIPNREVVAGRLDRFGTLDPTQGGRSARHQLFASYRLRPADGKSEINAMVYVGHYDLDLYSNFTGYLEDSIDGDQITQKDRRTFYGGQGSYKVAHQLGGLRFDTSIGANARIDSIDSALDHSKDRKKLAPIVEGTIGETSVGTFVKEELTPASWLRFVSGARADFFSFDVDEVGAKSATQASPKTSAIVTPLRAEDVQLDLYANYGHGFHSNDARGIVRPTNPVTPLTRAIGYEVGARARLWDRLDVAVAGWRLDLANETVWVGDEGTTEVSDATRRFGGELETRFAFTKWLAADLDLTATKSAFVVNRGNGDAVALAPRFTWAGGLSARHPSGVRGGVRFYGVGDRPATEDEVLTAEGFTIVDLHLGYGTRRWDVGFDVENLFDQKYRSAQFATTSRLPSEPPTGRPAPAGTCTNGSRAVTQTNGNFGGCEDINFTPGYPLTLRVMTTVYLD